ncbi:MAG: hypothetical protein RL653_3745 [Pseudomonadota bacterium]|jgi:hypothetical protein
MRRVLGWALLSWWSAASGAWGAGPLAEMSSRDGTGFAIVRGDPLGGWFEEGLGRSSARVDAQGGSAELDLALPGGTWRLSLERAGAAWDLQAHGPGSPWGLDGAVPARAYFALHGPARLWRDGQEMGTFATQIFALRAGTHVDDATHALQPAARDGDLELEWLVLLPSGPVLRFFFDDVRLEGEGAAQVGQAPVPEGTAPPNVGLTALTAPVQSPAPPRAGIFPVEASAIRVRNAAPAAPLPDTPAPANAGPATPLPRTVEVGSGRLFLPLPSTPSPFNAGGTPPPAQAPSGASVPGQTVPSLPVIPTAPAVPLSR